MAHYMSWEARERAAWTPEDEDCSNLHTYKEQEGREGLVLYPYILKIVWHEFLVFPLQFHGV